MSLIFMLMTIDRALSESKRASRAI